jgi:hypothetical protein
VESLKKADGTLHPVQDEMVKCHGSQCGFCTPGIVMSLVNLVQVVQKPNRQQITDSLSGNLCRCTGYKPIIDAAAKACDRSSELKIDDSADVPLLKEIKRSSVPTLVNLFTGTAAAGAAAAGTATALSTAQIISLGASVASAGIGAMGAIQQGKAAKAMAKSNAAQAETAAQDAQRRGEEDAIDVQRRGAALAPAAPPAAPAAPGAPVPAGRAAPGAAAPAGAAAAPAAAAAPEGWAPAWRAAMQSAAGTASAVWTDVCG